MEDLIRRFTSHPIIAAVRREGDLAHALQTPVNTVFILRSDIFMIKKQVDAAKKNGKNVFIHVDFIAGLARDMKAMDYISKVIAPDGIISTHSGFIKYARDNGIFTIQRFFMVDSLSYVTVKKEVRATQPDMVEIMPGIMPKVIALISNEVAIPVIAGGMIDRKEEILGALKAGASAISTGNRKLWSETDWLKRSE